MSRQPGLAIAAVRRGQDRPRARPRRPARARRLAGLTRGWQDLAFGSGPRACPRLLHATRRGLHYKPHTAPESSSGAGANHGADDGRLIFNPLTPATRTRGSWAAASRAVSFRTSFSWRISSYARPRTCGRLSFHRRVARARGRCAAAALARIAAARPVRAVIVGGGPDAETFKSQAHNLGLDGSVVVFPGAMPAPEAFPRGRCLVVPSRAESFPYVVLEAGAAGKPLIATRVGGIPEIVAGTAMELIAPGSVDELVRAMERVLADPRCRRRAAARVTSCSKFTVAAMTDAVLDFYRAHFSVTPRCGGALSRLGAVRLGRDDRGKGPAMSPHVIPAGGGRAEPGPRTLIHPRARRRQARLAAAAHSTWVRCRRRETPAVAMPVEESDTGRDRRRQREIVGVELAVEVAPIGHQGAHQNRNRLAPPATGRGATGQARAASARRVTAACNRHGDPARAA